jgi:hypothetical protein
MDNKLLLEIANEVECETRGSSQGYESYDTWGCPDRSNKFLYLKYHLFDKGKNGFKLNDKIYIIEYRRANGHTNMAGTPDSIAVRSMILFDGN